MLRRTIRTLGGVGAIMVGLSAAARPARAAVAELPDDPPVQATPAAPPPPRTPPAPSAPGSLDIDEPMPVPLTPPPKAPPAPPPKARPAPHPKASSAPKATPAPAPKAAPAPPAVPAPAVVPAAPASHPPAPAAVPVPSPSPPPAPVEPPDAGGPVPWPAAGPGGPARAGWPPPAAAPSASAAAFEEFSRRTKLGAYGTAQLFVEQSSGASAKLPLVALSIDHRPTDWVRLAAAIQVEDGTSFGVQQLLIDVSPVRAVGVRAGLMILPLGLGNLQPQPTADLGVARPLTDQLIIPTVWRELGAGVFGEAAHLRYHGAVVSGLDASGFSPLAPLWGGRGDGSSLAIHDAAVVGRLELADLPPGLTVGAAGYTGGAAHGNPALAGVRTGVVEGDLRYHQHGLNVRAEYARLYIINSYKVNDYLGLLGQSAVPARGRGFYVEVGYDLLQLAPAASKQVLELFGAFENVNARSVMSPYNYNPPAITGPGQLPPEAPSTSRSFVRGGLDYRPRPPIVVKADVQVALDGVGLPPGVPLQAASGAPGTPKAVSASITDAARGATRFGLAIGFDF